MFLKKSILTIASKTVILLANFLLVIITAQIWGSEGRGEIALIMANIAIIIIFNNITSGGSVAFNASKIKKLELLSTSFLGTLIISLTGSIVFSLYYGSENFKHLFIISILTSISNSFSNYYLGIKNLKWFNLLNVLNPISVLIFLFIIYYWFNLTNLNTFFYAYYLGYGVIVLLGFYKTFSTKNIVFNFIDKISLKNILKYGFNNELSSLFQFLNYRLSYFFIAEIINLQSLGIFSVAVAVAEAIWIVSKSMSAILYSEILNSKSRSKNIALTIKFAKQNLGFSLILSALVFLIPNSLFIFVFGDSFADVKTITLYLIPGIIFIATSNIFGHYFAGIGKLNILKNKSYFGFITTLITAFIFIPKYGIIGACLSLNSSYFISSLYLFIMFLKDTKKQLY